MQDQFVTYTFSDHVWGSKSSAWEAEMRESAVNGGNKFGFDTSRFVEAVKNKEAAYNAMRDAIVASTADNPLFIRNNFV